MRHDIEEDIGVALDPEIKAPSVVHTGLPDVMNLIVFLGAQGRVPEILG